MKYKSTGKRMKPRGFHPWFGKNPGLWKNLCEDKAVSGIPDELVEVLLNLRIIRVDGSTKTNKQPPIASGKATIKDLATAPIFKAKTSVDSGGKE